MSGFAVEFGPPAARAYERLPQETQKRIRTALERLAHDVAVPGRIGGKRVKTLRGTTDSFHRLRVGDYRVMFDVIQEDLVILVLGVVHRSELERWLRAR